MLHKYSVNTWAFILFLFTLIALLINIQFPRGYNFDEFHYVPSAKQFIELKENQNWEHPPLAKELMAISILVGGDRPFGWRLGSAVFGAATVSFIFLFALSLFRSRAAAFWITAITFFNQGLYVQSRIGMLDSYMIPFFILTLFAFTELYKRGTPQQIESPFKQSNQSLFIILGTSIGLAIACKWTGAILWFTLLGFIALFYTLNFLKIQFNPLKKNARLKDDSDFYHPNLLKIFSFKKIFLFLFILPVFIYFLTFIPYLFIERTPAYTLLDIWDMQYKMYDGQLRVVGKHPYHSEWWGWPIMIRPIWYAFDKEAAITSPTEALLGQTEEFVRGVIFLGNPAIMWFGLVSILYCIRDFFKKRSQQAFLLLALWSAFFWSWGIIPRKVSFFYYYYPAMLILSFSCYYFFKSINNSRNWAIANARWIFLGVVIGLFFYFFPILAALKIPSNSFIRWMWFQSWI